jgi:arylsulfatase A-like enzyme
MKRLSWPALSRWFGRRRRRPNVVWICADDYNPSVSGTYGSPTARTPNLDRLASRGLRFDRAYCSCPLSTPSRMSFLTGRYPRSVGVTLSPTPLPDHEVTIGRLLGDAGYATVALGKTHYYKPLAREFDRCLDLREFYTHLASGDRELFPDGVELLGPWAPFGDPASVWLNAAGLPYAFDAEMPDTFFSGRAEEFLAGRPPRPFFLWVGFYVTHAPFRFPVESRGLFDPAAFPVPEVGPEDEGRVPEVFRDLTGADKRGIIASYHTSVAYMDRNLGSILKALDRAGLADDTLVIFNSDHGYLLGEHGRFEKHCCHEEAVRTALVMRLPGLIEPGGATSALVELVDVVPTVLELCGAEIPAQVQGRSLAPLLRGESSTHRDLVISEYADNAEAMVRTDRWKLIHCAGNRRRRDGYAVGRDLPGPSTRLYDLLADPSELRDVAGLAENREVVDRLLGVLAAHMKATDPDPASIPESDDPRAILRACLLPTDGWARDRFLQSES